MKIVNRFYLSNHQIKSLTKGNEVTFFRRGVQYFVGPKAVVDTAKQREIRKLERELAKLKGNHHICPECGKTCRNKKGLTLHRNIVHFKTVKSNLVGHNTKNGKH